MPPLVALLLLVVALPWVRADGETDAEIKFTVDEAGIDKALMTISKRAGKPKTHTIYFFDTPDLAFYENARGPVILRARQKQGRNPETTVKFRERGGASAIARRVSAMDDVETQIEWIVGARPEPESVSYSIGNETKMRIENLENRKTGVKELFSAEQRRFISIASGGDAKEGNLRVFGPIRANVWEWNEQDPRVSTKVTAELWPLGSARILELSIKRRPKNLDRKVAEFVQYLNDLGLKSTAGPQPKTLRALTHFRDHAAR